VNEVIEWDQWIHKSLVLNQNSMPHYHPANKIKRELKVLGKVAGKQLKRRFRKVRLEVTVSYPVLWDADAANYYPTMKAYVDGLVNKPPTVKGQKQLPAQGILIDDSDKYFDGPHLTGSGERSGRKDFFRFACKLEVLE
jgi:hypothetical protein